MKRTYCTLSPVVPHKICYQDTLSSLYTSCDVPYRIRYDGHRIVPSLVEWQLDFRVCWHPLQPGIPLWVCTVHLFSIKELYKDIFSASHIFSSSQFWKHPLVAWESNGSFDYPSLLQNLPIFHLSWCFSSISSRRKLEMIVEHRLMSASDLSSPWFLEVSPTPEGGTAAQFFHLPWGGKVDWLRGGMNIVEVGKLGYQSIYHCIL